MRKIVLLSFFLFLYFTDIGRAQVLIEAERFDDYGGWLLDHQFMDQMGSPYLLAHGAGKPVENASTEVIIPIAGTYKVFVRTYNWISPWYKESDGPGGFKVRIHGEELPNVLGTKGDGWMWQEAGVIDLCKDRFKKGFHSKGQGERHRFDGVVAKVELVDLSGFDGRCDAIYLTQDMSFVPPADGTELRNFRKENLGIPEDPEIAGSYDLVVVGGGIAGCTTALSAARLGLKVALVDDRPVLGGANTYEIGVGVNGGVSHNYYTNLGNVVRELTRMQPYSPEDKNRSDSRKQGPFKTVDDKRDFRAIESHRENLIASEPNITVYHNTRIFDVVMKNEEKKGTWVPGTEYYYDVKVDNNIIAAVLGVDVVTGKEIALISNLFADCTGDGCVGYLAGADYRIGREGYYETFEPSAPYISDNLKMGSTIKWDSIETGKECSFPVLPWAAQCSDDYHVKTYHYTWNWESGFEMDPFKDGEKIRDNNLRAIYGNWSYLKNNYKEEFAERELSNVGYLCGKRESRRLLGDVILSENDILGKVDYPDKSFTTTWSMDLHYPDEENSKFFPGTEWLSWCSQPEFEPYHVPYRTLYSRNIRNLFMAGRNISVTHVALGTVRVQATTGMMGEVVGMAAKICHDNNVEPRDVYEKYLDILKLYMQDGVEGTAMNLNK